MIPGQIWKHYKGEEYKIITVALLESTAEPMVVYTPHTRGGAPCKNWVRPAKEFLDKFKLVGSLEDQPRRSVEL